MVNSFRCSFIAKAAKFFLVLFLCLLFAPRSVQASEITLNPNFHSRELGGYWGDYVTWQENAGKDCSVDPCSVPGADDVAEINGTVVVDTNRTVGGVLVSETGALNGYLHTLTIGDIINNGSIDDYFTLAISGRIENNGAWKPYQTTLLNDVEVMSTATLGGSLECNGHALVVNAPNVVTLSDETSGDDIYSGTGIVELDDSVRGTISGDISELHISHEQMYKYIDAEITALKVVFKVESIITAKNTVINGDVEIDEGVFIGHLNGATTLAINGNIVNNGEIHGDGDNGLFVEVSGSIENNGIWSPSKTVLPNDVEVINTTTLRGSLECSGHALVVNSPNVVTLASETSGDDIYNGTGIVELASSVRGNISGTIPELHIVNYQMYKYIDVEMSVPKVVFRTDALIAGAQTVINGNVEIDPGVVLQNWNGYSRTLVVNGDVTNNGTVRNNYSNPLYVKVAGNIYNNGTWVNEKTYLTWDPVLIMYEFNISDVKDVWSDPILLAENLYEITDLIDEVKYWRVRADLGGIYSPWSETKTINGDLSENQTPTLSLLAQYKSDGETELGESHKTTGDIVVFSAQLDDADGDQVELQVELRAKDTDFTGNDDGGILDSGPVAAGNEATITTGVLADNEYHWRTRVIDERGTASEWQEFGTAGNTDFEIKTVPLYTQVRSNYPSDTDTQKWFNVDYDHGSAIEDCGKSIAQCGCAITSVVMTLRYHGITENIDGNDINPRTINEWLENSTSPYGYFGKGITNWEAVEAYAKDPITGSERIYYDRTRNGTQDNEEIKNILNRNLAENQPVILYTNASYKHFLLATERLNNTYLIRDPYFYNTKNLNQEVTPEDDAMPYNNYKQDYNNQYIGIRPYTTDRGLLSYSHSVKFVIASPAELLVIDSNGRRLGKDPISGTEYFEIEGGTYTSEGIGNPENPDAEVHEVKNIWIPDPDDGEYQVKVIGTGEGEYTFYSTVTDQSGESKSDVFESNTEPGLETEYNLNYDSEDANNSEILPSDNEEKSIDDVIADVEYAYTESWITKKQVKNVLIRALEKVQKYAEKYDQQEEQRRQEFEKRLGKCSRKRNVERCEDNATIIYERVIQKLNEVRKKIIIKTYEGILKQLDLYKKKGWINDEGYNLLKEDIEWLVADMQTS